MKRVKILFQKLERFFKKSPPALILIAFLLLSISLLTDIPQRQRGGFFSDEAVYFSIIQSIAYDYDIKYERKDIYRIRKEFPAGPNGIFLKKAKNGKLYFAKSFAYPLFSAPFYRFLGVKGIILFNSILLILVLYAGFLLLKKWNYKNPIYYILFFVFGSIVWFYFLWITPDLFNFSIVFLSLFLFFYYKDSGSNIPIVFSAFLMGVASFSKLPNVFTAILPGVYFLFIKRDLKKTFIFSFIFLVTFTGFYALNYQLTGEVNYMGGERKSFYFRFPYEGETTFENSGYKMTAGTYWKRYYMDLKVFFLNLFYSFFGRYTGIFIYFFPALLFMLLYILKKEKDVLKNITISLYFFIHLFYITLIPSNYFGGAGSLGNRYFFNFIPLLFFLAPRKLNEKNLLIFSIIPILFLGPVFVDVIYYSAYSGELSKNPVISLFPPDLTQINSVPTNTNPYAFKVPLVNSRIFVLNNNFRLSKEEKGIWIRKSGKIEFVLETTKKFKALKLYLKNNPLNRQNKITIKIGGRKRKIYLNGGEGKIVLLKNIKPQLIIRQRFYYYGTIKTSTDSIPFFVLKGSKDKRVLSLFFKPVFEECVE